ncbi:MAG: hypothetical protein ABSB94_21245 [Syntrophorhabdales bacterium]|jgi:hypothetical protein
MTTRNDKKHLGHEDIFLAKLGGRPSLRANRFCFSFCLPMSGS